MIDMYMYDVTGKQNIKDEAMKLCHIYIIKKDCPNSP